MSVNTIKILELDGGGERGIMSLYFFMQFLNQWGIPPSQIAQNFDVICGTSVGGIMALSLASGKTPDEMLPFFTDQGPYIFSLSSLIASLRPNLAAKLALITLDTPFYQSSGPTANSYGSGLLSSTLVSEFGTDTMQNLQTSVIIPAYQSDTSTYKLFSNLNYAEFIGQNELISNVALATSAAPIYLPAATFGGHTYIDGGVYQNNAAQFGLTVGKMKKPNATRACVLSLGTGLGEMGFDPGNPDFPYAEYLSPAVAARANEISANIEAFNSIATIFGLFDIAATGGQESVARSLYLESTYTLNNVFNYRFQPNLDLTINTELDNTDTAILEYYEETATNYYNDDIDNISTFIGHLTA